MLYNSTLYGDELFNGITYLGTWEKTISFTYLAGTTVLVEPTVIGAIPEGCFVLVYAGETLLTLSEIQQNIKNPILFLSQTSGATNLFLKLELYSTISTQSFEISSFNIEVEQETSLYTMATSVLSDGLTKYQTPFMVDTELQNYLVPYAWITDKTHREALSLIGDACGGVTYQDRNGVIRIDGGNYIKNKMLEASTVIINEDRIINISSPISDVKNIIKVGTSPIVKSSAGLIWTLQGTNLINAGESLTFTPSYQDVAAVINAVATLGSSPSGATITSESYYSNGASITVLGSVDGQIITLHIDGEALHESGKEIIEVSDGDSIRKNGEKTLSIINNNLIQNVDMAYTLGNSILGSTKESMRDLDLEWRGDPSIEIGDKITVNSQEGIVLTQDFSFNGALKSNIRLRRG